MNTAPLLALDLARLSLALALGGAGVGFVLLGVLAVLRFPDLFTRTHGYGVISGLGAALVLIALALLGASGAFAARLALLGLAVLCAGPLIAHLAAGAAHAAGLAPISGAHTAPRPGRSLRRDEPA